MGDRGELNVQVENDALRRCGRATIDAVASFARRALRRRRALAIAVATAFAATGAATSPAIGAEPPAPSPPEKPNIVYILADDLGYGDVSALNANSKIQTPAMDRVAREGMTFTDAHACSAVCTPSRYGILTGRYSWRSRLGPGVLLGFDPPLIDRGRLTVAGMLKAEGYDTACFGKWHLGMTWPALDGKPVDPAGANVDYQKPIRDGPTTRGFDHFFGISASADMPPWSWIDDDHVTAKPAGDGFDAFGKVRHGPAAPGLRAEDLLPTVESRAVDYLVHRPGAAPFFMYVALPSPHGPIAPAPAFVGKSGIGPYGDYVVETDWAVGQILATLDQTGESADTLLIVASDNGASPVADFPALLARGHNPNYVFRGCKATIWEGGHRIPFLVRWPGHVAAGAACAETVSLTDFLATVAGITGYALPANAGEDSVDLRPLLLGEPHKSPYRRATVYASMNLALSIQEDRWKLALCPYSGADAGWTSWLEPMPDLTRLPPTQLYDMTADVSERSNVSAAHPDVVKKLSDDLKSLVQRGRSTPGPDQANDVPVDIYRGTTRPVDRRDGD